MCLKNEEKRLRIGMQPLDDNLEIDQLLPKKPPHVMILPKPPKKFEYINQQLKLENSKTHLSDNHKVKMQEKVEIRKKYEPPMTILSRENKPRIKTVNSKVEKLNPEFDLENGNLENDELLGVIRGKSGFIIKTNNHL
jgi:hypothetical protein